ncbi:L,D-transpeptidase family protein [Streptomyces sp. NPDC001811]
MRIPGSSAALLASAAALAALCGCTVQPAGADGKQGLPVHVEPPGGTGSGAARSGRGPGSTWSSPVPGAARTAPADPPTDTPGVTPSVPVPRVLWSRGDSGPAVRELQARLRQVAWLAVGPTGSYDGPTEQAVKGFQGKRGLPRTGATDAVTWQRLVAMTRPPGRGELYPRAGRPAAAADPRCMTGRVLCISKTSRTLRWMVGGRTLSTMAVRFGAQYTPTREGVFTVYWKSRHHVSTLYHSPMPYAMFFSGGQAVHYSYDFAARGYAGGSHGCVNVRDETAIARLFAQVRIGDKVVVSW